MTHKHAALAAAVAALLAAPAYAQNADCSVSSSNLQSNCPDTNVLGAGSSTMSSGSTVTNSSGASVSSGTGVTVTPGVPSASVTVTPSSTTVAMPSAHLLPGGATVEASSTTVLGGPSGTASGSRTVITRYWVNVPANVENRADFQRWTRLK